MFLPMLNTEVKYYYTINYNLHDGPKREAGLAQPQLLEMTMK